MILVKEVQARVAAKFDVSLEDLVGPRRHSHLIAARHVAMSLCAELCPHQSGVRIARLFGGRDHTTFLSAKKRLPDKLARYPELAAAYAELKADLSE